MLAIVYFHHYVLNPYTRESFKFESASTNTMFISDLLQEKLDSAELHDYAGSQLSDNMKLLRCGTHR